MMNSDSPPRRSTQEAGQLSRSSNRSEDCAGFMVGKLTQTAIPGQASVHGNQSESRIDPDFWTTRILWIIRVIL
jgi:hypothetical protein